MRGCGRVRSAGDHHRVRRRDGRVRGERRGQRVRGGLSDLQLDRRAGRETVADRAGGRVGVRLEDRVGDPVRDPIGDHDVARLGRTVVGHRDPPLDDLTRNDRVGQQRLGDGQARLRLGTSGGRGDGGVRGCGGVGTAGDRHRVGRCDRGVLCQRAAERPAQQ